MNGGGFGGGCSRTKFSSMYWLIHCRTISPFRTRRWACLHTIRKEQRSSKDSVVSICAWSSVGRAKRLIAGALVGVSLMSLVKSCPSFESERHSRRPYLTGAHRPYNHGLIFMHRFQLTCIALRRSPKYIRSAHSSKSTDDIFRLELCRTHI